MPCIQHSGQMARFEFAVGKKNQLRQTDGI